MIIGMGIFYGGIAQLIVGSFELKKGHTFIWSIFAFICIVINWDNIFHFNGADNIG